jgi:hypothetical protein
MPSHLAMTMEAMHLPGTFTDVHVWSITESTPKIVASQLAASLYLPQGRGLHHEAWARDYGPLPGGAPGPAAALS